MIDIAPDQHFLRYSKRTHIVEKDGLFTISSSNFFLRRDRGEEYLSGAWYEFFKAADEDDVLKKAASFMRARGFKKLDGAFSLHNVADVLAKSSAQVQYAVKQFKSDDAYSGILPQPTTLHDAEAIAETVSRVLRGNW